jgi:hypothetical protein
MKKHDELTSFNEELVSFDVDDLSIEVLEERFELAVASVFTDVFDCNLCSGLTCAGVDCSGLICGKFVIVQIP